MSIETKQAAMLEKNPELFKVILGGKSGPKEKQRERAVLPEALAVIEGKKVKYTGHSSQSYKNQVLYAFEWLEGPRKGTHALTVEPHPLAENFIYANK